MSKEGRSTNVPILPASSQVLHSSLGLRNYFVIGHSSFVIHNAAPPSDRPWRRDAQESLERAGRPCRQRRRKCRWPSAKERQWRTQSASLLDTGAVPVRWFCLRHSDFGILSSLGIRHLSFTTQRLHRIDFRRPPRGKKPGHQRDG